MYKTGAENSHSQDPRQKDCGASLITPGPAEGLHWYREARTGLHPGFSRPGRRAPYLRCTHAMISKAQGATFAEVRMGPEIKTSEM